jgi:hypothetical protein
MHETLALFGQFSTKKQILKVLFFVSDRLRNGKKLSNAILSLYNSTSLSFPPISRCLVSQFLTTLDIQKKISRQLVSNYLRMIIFLSTKINELTILFRYFILAQYSTRLTIY